MKSRQPAKIIPALLFMGVIVGFAQAAPRTTSWDDLRQLKPGEKIQVVQKDRKSWSGSFVRFSDDSISFKAPDGDKNVPRADVMRVSRRGGKRLRNALIGAAAGGGTGAAIGAAAGGCSNRGFSFCFGRGLPAAVFGAIGVAAGGGVGAAIPGKTVIYRSPVK